jgi:hypothetical protein
MTGRRALSSTMGSFSTSLVDKWRREAMARACSCSSGWLQRPLYGERGGYLIDNICEKRREEKRGRDDRHYS